MPRKRVSLETRHQLARLPGPVKLSPGFREAHLLYDTCTPTGQPSGAWGSSALLPGPLATETVFGPKNVKTHKTTNETKPNLTSQHTASVTENEMPRTKSASVH